MKKMFSMLSIILYVLCCLDGGYAQELGNATPANPGQSELTYFLGQQDAIKAASPRLQVLMDELRKKYAADAALRGQIREREAFAIKLQNLRSDAQRFTNPALLPALESLINDAQDSVNNLRSDLNALVRASNADDVALKTQIDNVQTKIDLNNKLAKSLADTIKNIQNNHLLEGVGAELDALVKTPGGDIPGNSPTTGLPRPNKER